VLALGGIAQDSHDLVIDLYPMRGNYKPSVPLSEGVVNEGLDTQACAVGGDLHLARSQS